jgi:hypothetical protein
MPAREAFNQCREYGLLIETDGKDLFCSPRELLTDELRESLRTHKPAIIELLRSRLADCPLLQAGLNCHISRMGRCNHDPAGCNIANGMRRYISKMMKTSD